LIFLLFAYFIAFPDFHCIYQFTFTNIYQYSLQYLLILIAFIDFFITFNDIFHDEIEILWSLVNLALSKKLFAVNLI